MLFNAPTVLKIFEAFSINRWNDLARPFAPVEMDKTAEKMFLAFFLGKLEEKTGAYIDWSRIIYHTFFELLRKIALCDIKAPVQRLIREKYPQEYTKLNDWVITQYTDLLDDTSLIEEFKTYLREAKTCTDISSRILQAAHKYSTFREFELLKNLNEPVRMREIERCLRQDLSEFMDLRGVRQLISEQNLFYLVTEIETLRFQIRWNQTPRVPATSVLGHSYFVAAVTLLMSRSLNLSDTRLYNNFFSALFHDLPEAVTRDIISPVKQATDHLPEVVKQIEDMIVHKELLPLMDESYRDEVMFYMQDEFKNRIFHNGRTEVIPFEMLDNYDKKEYHPTDGMLVRCADHIAAFVEADSSISHGITSVHLEEGKNNILLMYPSGKIVNGLDVDSFFCHYRSASSGC